jgi:tripartite-type tricarboxylate transporter receptor subunit TctC
VIKLAARDPPDGPCAPLRHFAGACEIDITPPSSYRTAIMRNRLIPALAVLVAAAVPAHADPVEDFYKGRNVTVLIGYSPGGSYDAAGRVLAHYMGRYIPGNPSLVPQNMPGAGTLNLVNYLYNVSPKDGTAFGIFARGMAMEPLIGGTNAKFDATKLTWIGSAANEISVCATYATSPVKSWNDALTKEFTVAGNGSGSDPDVFANVLRNRFGVKDRLISGFPGSSEISLAMERGEIDGRCGWSWSSIKAEKAQWLAEHKLNIVVQLALEKAPDLPNVPLITELATDDRQRQILKLIFSRQTMGRPFAGPPGIPAERAEALRKAFDLTMKDPEFLAEAEKRGLEINPVSGRDLEKLISELYQTPKDIVAEAHEAIERVH